MKMLVTRLMKMAGPMEILPTWQHSSDRNSNQSRRVFTSKTDQVLGLLKWLRNQSGRLVATSWNWHNTSSRHVITARHEISLWSRSRLRRLDKSGYMRLPGRYKSGRRTLRAKTVLPQCRDASAGQIDVRCCTFQWPSCLQPASDGGSPIRWVGLLRCRSTADSGFGFFLCDQLAFNCQDPTVHFYTCYHSPYRLFPVSTSSTIARQLNPISSV